MIIQLDFSKAYNKISWEYMEAVLGAFGFDNQWIDWIMVLVSSPNFSILLNGDLVKPFFPFRGIRQGDPMSPFLVFIMMQDLGRAIFSTNTEGDVRCLKLHE